MPAPTLSGWLNRLVSRAASRQHQFRRPLVELLEERRLLSVASYSYNDQLFPGATIVRTRDVVQYDPASAPMRLNASAPRQANASGFDIVLKKGANLAANPAASAAFDQAALFLESIFSDPITVVVDADIASLGPGILGQTGSVSVERPYDEVRGLMISDAALDEQSLLSRLPLRADFSPVFPNDGKGVFTFTGLIDANRANLMALGVDPATLQTGPLSQYDPAVRRDMDMVFSSDFAFDYNRSDGINAGQYDFTGVVIHEIVHGLGFVSKADEVDYALVVSSYTRAVSPNPMDLFRMAPGQGQSNFSTAQRLLTTGNYVNDQVFYDGIYAGTGFNIPGLTVGDVPLSTGTYTGDGHQASHWKDDADTGVQIGMMDPTAPGTGIQMTWSSTDQRAMALLGYDIGASVSGFVFLDSNDDGFKAGGEQALGGFTAYVDANNNGALDTGELTTVTTNQGLYAFAGLPAGTYTIRLTDRPGFVISTPASGFYTVTLAAGEQIPQQNFGMRALSEFVVDNVDAAATITGSWTVASGGTGQWGADFLTDANDGKGLKSVRYRPELPFSGNYMIYADWIEGPDRATNVPITINYAGGSQTITVDQQQMGGQWVLLGEFPIIANNTASVTISTEGTNGTVVADAIRFVRVGNVDPPAAPKDLVATSISETKIRLTWSDFANNESGVLIDRSTDNEHWTQVAYIREADRVKYVGANLAAGVKYYFRVRAYNSAGVSDYTNVATATTDPGGTTVTIDNIYDNVVRVGTWTSKKSISGFYNLDYLQDNAAGDGNSSYTFLPTFPQAGTYQVSLRWTAAQDRATNVPVTVQHDNGTTTSTFNQQIFGATWVVAGVYNFNAGTNGSVMFSNAGANGRVVVDAVRFVRLAAIAPLPLPGYRAAATTLRLRYWHDDSEEPDVVDIVLPPAPDA